MQLNSITVSVHNTHTNTHTNTYICIYILIFLYIYIYIYQGNLYQNHHRAQKHKEYLMNLVVQKTVKDMFSVHQCVDCLYQNILFCTFEFMLHLAAFFNYCIDTVSTRICSGGNCGCCWISGSSWLFLRVWWIQIILKSKICLPLSVPPLNLLKDLKNLQNTQTKSAGVIVKNNLD